MNSDVCRSHLGKLSYRSAEEALSTFRRMTQRPGLRGSSRWRGRVKTYRCADCGLYFLASERAGEGRRRLRDLRKAKGEA
jgi:hypothetical protein